MAKKTKQEERIEAVWREEPNISDSEIKERHKIRKAKKQEFSKQQREEKHSSNPKLVELNTQAAAFWKKQNVKSRKAFDNLEVQEVIQSWIRAAQKAEAFSPRKIGQKGGEAKKGYQNPLQRLVVQVMRKLATSDDKIIWEELKILVDGEVLLEVTTDKIYFVDNKKKKCVTDLRAYIARAKKIISAKPEKIHE